MADELKDQRIPIMMSPSEVKAIDDWMFANRLKSRARAVRILVQKGFMQDNSARLNQIGMEIIGNFANKKPNGDLFEKYKQAASIVAKDTQRYAEYLLGQMTEANELAEKYKNISTDLMKEITCKDDE